MRIIKGNVDAVGVLLVSGRFALSKTIIPESGSTASSLEPDPTHLFGGLGPSPNPLKGYGAGGQIGYERSETGWRWPDVDALDDAECGWQAKRTLMVCGNGTGNDFQRRRYVETVMGAAEAAGLAHLFDNNTYNPHDILGKPGSASKL